MKSIIKTILSLLAGVIYLPLVCVLFVVIGIVIAIFFPIGIVILAGMYVYYVIVNKTNKGFMDYINNKSSDNV